MKTITVCDTNGDEFDFSEDDDTEYEYNYGRGVDKLGNESINADELNIYQDGIDGYRLKHVFFKPRHIMITWD